MIEDLLLPTLFCQSEPLPNELRRLATLATGQAGQDIPDLRSKAPQQFAALRLITTAHVDSITSPSSITHNDDDDDNDDDEKKKNNNNKTNHHHHQPLLYMENAFKILLQLFVHEVGSSSVGKHCKHSYVTNECIPVLVFYPVLTLLFFFRQSTTLSQQWGSFLLDGGQ